MRINKSLLVLVLSLFWCWTRYHNGKLRADQVQWLFRLCNLLAVHKRTKLRDIIGFPIYWTIYAGNGVASPHYLLSVSPHSSGCHPPLHYFSYMVILLDNFNRNNKSSFITPLNWLKQIGQQVGSSGRSSVIGRGGFVQRKKLKVKLAT